MLTRARAKQAASVAPWADLLPEVVQRIAELLDDKGRVAMMRTCTAWFAAIEAAPQLWPSARLHGPEAVAELGSWDWNEDSVSWAGVEQVLMDAAAKSQAAVERAAALDPLTWRVEISGCGDQPALLLAMVAALPPTVRQLNLAAECRGPLCLMLQRMRRLEDLSIASDLILGLTANGAFVDWRGPGAAGAIAKLSSLRLDYRKRPQWDGEFTQDAEIAPVPANLPAALAPATRLTSLELLASWPAPAARLCTVLPALEDLRLTVYQCAQADSSDALAAVAQLPRLRTLDLTFASCWPGTGRGVLPDVCIVGWDEWVRLPPMAQLADRLTALTLAGAVSLPPDWDQLCGMQLLRIVSDAQAAGIPENQGGVVLGADPTGWGAGSFANLDLLEELDMSDGTVLPDAADVARAPKLTTVLLPHAEFNTWRSAVRGLRPEVVVWPSLL